MIDVKKLAVDYAYSCYPDSREEEHRQYGKELGFKEGFTQAETYYKDIAVKYARYYTEYTLEFMKSGKEVEDLILPEKLFELFLKELENE